MLQHEVDFQYALDQVVYFYGVPLEESKFDVQKAFHNKETMHLRDILGKDEDDLVEADVGIPPSFDHIEVVQDDAISFVYLNNPIAIVFLGYSSIVVGSTYLYTTLVNK